VMAAGLLTIAHNSGGRKTWGNEILGHHGWRICRSDPSSLPRPSGERCRCRRLDFPIKSLKNPWKRYCPNLSAASVCQGFVDSLDIENGRVLWRHSAQCMVTLFKGNCGNHHIMSS
jgi:hypothetical protein